jgi:hypothetical protein
VSPSACSANASHAAAAISSPPTSLTPNARASSLAVSCRSPRCGRGMVISRIVSLSAVSQGGRSPGRSTSQMIGL